MTLSTPIHVNDPAAFRKVYDQTFHYALCLAKSMVSQQDAEDIIVDLYVNVWRLKPVFKTEKEMYSYLTYSIRNACHNLTQYKKHFVPVPEIEQEETYIIDALLIKKIMALIDELPPRQRKIIQLRYLEGLSIKEIAILMKSNPRTVMNLCSTGIRTLRLNKSKLSKLM